MTGATGTGKFEFGCCNYGTAFAQTATGYDCAKIPIPTKKTDSASLPNHAYGFCGGEFGTAGSIAAATVCCTFPNPQNCKSNDNNKYLFLISAKSVPFHIRFLSDLYEVIAEAGVTPNGFRLAYTLMGC